MTDISELYNDPCQKLNPWCIDAYAKLKLDPLSPTDLTLDTSWGESTVDMAPVVKAGETITHLLLTDTALQFSREDYGRDGAENNGVDCIAGDALSRIVSMQLLKDVAQPSSLANGDVYMWNSNSQLFETFNLQVFVNQTNTRLTNLENRMAAVENRVTNLESAIQDILRTLNSISSAIAKPDWAPSSAALVWGTINDAYADNPTQLGLYSHNPANNITGDQRFK